MSEATSWPVRVEAQVFGRWVPATAHPLGDGSASVETLADREYFYLPPGRWRVVPGPTLASGVWAGEPTGATR